MVVIITVINNIVINKLTCVDPLYRQVNLFIIILIITVIIIITTTVKRFAVQSDRPKLEDLRGNLNIGMTLQSAKNIAKLGSKMLYSPVSGVGFFRRNLSYQFLQA